MMRDTFDSINMPAQPAVSFIVPAYNVADYIGECMESIEAQTFTDWEMLLINDGSTDDTGKICADWAARDPRIRFFDRENGGVSSARNLGIEEARGTYLAFVDPDDWLDPRYLELLYEAAVREDADFAECDIWRVDGRSGRMIHRACYGVMGKPYMPEEHMKYGPTATYKSISRRSLWIDNGVRLPDCSFESPAVYALVLALSRRTVSVREPLYYYRRFRKDSLIETGYAHSDGSQNNTLGIEAMAHLLCEFRRLGLYERYADVLEGVVKYRLTDILAMQFHRKSAADFRELVANCRAFLCRAFPASHNEVTMNWSGYNLDRVLTHLDLLHDPYSRINFSSLCSLAPAEAGAAADFPAVRISHRNAYRRIMVQREIDGAFWDLFDELQPEILFLDLMDERFDVLKWRGRYLTDSDALSGCEGFDPASDGAERIAFGSPEWLRVWKKGWETLLEGLRRRRDETGRACRLIVVESYLSEYLGDLEGGERFPEIDSIRRTNQVLEELYRHIRRSAPEAEMVRVREEPLYFTDRKYEYGAVPSHLNALVNRRIAGRIGAVLGPGSAEDAGAGTSREAFPDTGTICCAPIDTLREGLLNWYPMESGWRCLALGGAIPLLPLLRRRCANVDAAYDVPDKETAGDEGKYDLIAAKDILERSGEDPAELLARCAQLLSPGGRMLLCVRNRFGMRGLAGGIDDIVRTPFSHLESGEAEGGRLFARRDAEKLFADAGLAVSEVYYPLPDADWTQAVFTDHADPSEHLSDRVMFYDRWNSPLVASEARICGDVVREGMLAHAADVFLFELRRAQDPMPDGPRTAAAFPTTDRGETYGSVTRIMTDGTVLKRAVFPEGAARIRAQDEDLSALEARGLTVVPHRLGTPDDPDELVMPFVSEPPLLSEIRRLAGLVDAQRAVTEMFDRLKDDVLRSSGPSSLPGPELAALCEKRRMPYRPEWTYLSTGYIDLIPLNAFWTGECARYYDQEFTFSDCPAEYTLYRAVHYAWIHVPELEEVIPRARMLSHFGIDDEAAAAFDRAEQHFLETVRQTLRFGQFWAWARAARDAGTHAENRERLAGACAPEEEQAVGDILLARVHSVQMGLIRRFDELCRAHGLQYFAMHGTLLGAARHKGFIPWDDDVDLAMPREDYDRMVQAAAAELEEPFFLQTPENDPGCFHGGYARLQDDRTLGRLPEDAMRSCHKGIWIDIFPLDHCPSSARGLRRLQKRITFLQRLLYAKQYHVRLGLIGDVGGVRISAYYILKRLFTRDGLLKRLRRACTSCRPAGKRAILACYYGNRENINVFTEKQLAEPVMLPFEDMELPAFGDYEAFLAARYGEDWREYPPEKLRYRHNMAWLDPDRSWRDVEWS